MITCEEVLRELSNFLDGEVSPALRAEIEEHLNACHNCTVLFDSARKTLTLVADNYFVELPVGLTERVLERLSLQ